MINPLIYVSGALLGISLIGNIYMKVQVNGLRDDVVELQRELDLSKVDNVLLNAGIKEQNAKVEAMQINLSKKEKEFEDWKKLTPTVRYKTIYKAIEDTNSSGECDGLKDIVNSIGSINFNEL